MAAHGTFVSILLCLTVGLGAAAHTNLREKYPFSATLLNDANRGYYTLHWNFTREEGRIYFAVNVSTTGWVGFGLSPTGGMVNSDVVIGWVNNGAPYFRDRFADARAVPPVDENQDWCLTSAEEEGDYTIMEFNRRFSTCDSRDRNITTDTARVIWSFNPNDPTNNDHSMVLRHTQRGAASVNLLGGNPRQRPVNESELFLDVTVSDVTIPSARTTYWCESYRLPSAVVNTTHFVNRVSPSITPHASEFVHHILVYLCPSELDSADVGVSLPCHQTSETLGSCLSGVLIGAWAVGGDEFAYPEGIAFPVGGAGQEHFVVMEMHYDNPNQRSGVIDSSGLRFYYNTQEPTHRAGVMYLGLDVSPVMFVPPASSQFTVTSVCSAECTNTHIPDEGITIFGNVLHTHLAGRSVTISHYRRDPTTNQLIELEPLDQNLNYDFNFQQQVHLTPRVVKRGDILLMRCTYDTTDRDVVTYGGESTIEEMCLSFPVFYPRPADGSALISCSSTVNLTSSLDEFGTYVIVNGLVTLEELQNSSNFFPLIERLNWAGDPMLATSLQNSISSGEVIQSCRRENTSIEYKNVPIPTPDVRYVPPNLCSGVTPGQLSNTCLMDGGVSGAPPLVSASLLFVSLAAILLAIYN